MRRGRYAFHVQAHTTVETIPTISYAPVLGRGYAPKMRDHHERRCFFFSAGCWGPGASNPRPLPLTTLQRLGPVASAKVLKAAMELDLRARERSKVYRQTAPLLPL
jgi:hypothetical protein